MKQFSKALLVMTLTTASLSAWAQDVIVSGTVKDATGEPVIGASVVQKGTSNGAVTDLDGHFSFKAPQNSPLVISYIGYASQEVKASDDLVIELKENAKQLNEVVVTGYTTRRKADLTGSVAVVSTKDLKTSPDPDPMRALQGKVPGMTITSTGSPIGTGTVRICGIGSFNSSQTRSSSLTEYPLTWHSIRST